MGWPVRIGVQTIYRRTVPMQNLDPVDQFAGAGWFLGVTHCQAAHPQEGIDGSHQNFIAEFFRRQLGIFGKGSLAHFSNAHSNSRWVIDFSLPGGIDPYQCPSMRMKPPESLTRC